MTEVRSSSVMVRGEPCRVLEKGEGEPVGFLAGLRGAPLWHPFLDELAKTRRVVVPSLPGFPGGGTTVFRSLDDHLDWLAATLELLDGSGLIGADLIACSISGMLAADLAALSPATVKRLVLIGSWGLYETSDPGPDYFAQLETAQPALLVADVGKLASVMQRPADVDPTDWRVEEMRAVEAGARMSWPFGDRGLRKRLDRIGVATLIVWGEEDRLLPPAYAKRFAEGISGPTEVVTVPGAGHECVIDQPRIVAEHVEAFLAR